MKKLDFKPSAAASLGVELEFQIIDPHSYGLAPRAKELIRKIRKSAYHEKIKPEITQGMIEINSSVHQSPQTLQQELLEMKSFLMEQAQAVGVYISGGGTHPFQRWIFQKIFPTKRYKNLSHHYKYLSKRSTVFGQHIHIGCSTGEDAIYLTHALARYVPLFITLSASSPFYQGVDTGYQSSRSNVFRAFPSAGVMPYLRNWQEFTNYFFKMHDLGIIETMKDLYWDIRPKPEFGTVEVRVCDTPLTIRKAVNIAAFVQAVSLYLLKEKPQALNEDLYFLYHFNRFQALRYGYDGEFINPYNLKAVSIVEDFLNTYDLIQPYAKQLNSLAFIHQLQADAILKLNDTTRLRKVMKENNSFKDVVQAQCSIWAEK